MKKKKNMRRKKENKSVVANPGSYVFLAQRGQTQALEVHNMDLKAIILAWKIDCNQPTSA